MDCFFLRHLPPPLQPEPWRLFFIVLALLLFFAATASAGQNTSGTCGLIRTRGTSFELQAQIVDSAGAGGVLDTINFNFDPNSQKYIRNVFNTNPTTTNARISAVAWKRSHIFLGRDIRWDGF